MPGMRVLADLDCPKCGETYYADLPTGHGLSYPMLLEKRTGRVIDGNNVPWFADLLRKSYQQRQRREIPFKVERFRPLEKPLLLNCLDFLYGHSILKLLNAQYYLDHHAGHDLVLLIPGFLRWMAPDGAAAIWTLEQPLREGSGWNDWIAEQVHKQIDGLKSFDLAPAVSHPHPTVFDIQRFTRVKPFNFGAESWAEQTRSAPTVTFIWRDDRCWAPSRGIFRKSQNDQRAQERAIEVFGVELRKEFPNLKFAVAGIGEPCSFPPWIEDFRVTTPGPGTEEKWCRLYARSQIVVGMHGSNMLIPSAHAGAVVELLPEDRLGNVVQDLLPRATDPREALVRYRFVTADSAPAPLAKFVSSMLREIPLMLLNFTKPWCDPEYLARDADNLSIVRRQIA